MLGSPGRWTAEITIIVLDENGVAVDDAVLSGNSSEGAKGTGSYMMDVAGTNATISKANLKSSVGSVMFSVTGISLDYYLYDPNGANGPANVISMITFIFSSTNVSGARILSGSLQLVDRKKFF